MLFTEEERNSIPFVRTVSNKMRNNNKKLSDIAELEAKPAEQLKPEQKEKISKKQQIVEENQRFEEVLRLYKSIENDRKDNELSEADKTIHLMTLVGVLAEQPEVLIEKKIVTKDEIKFFEPLVSLRKKHACTKDALQQTKLFVKDYLKNDGLQGIVEKTIAHKDFAAIEWKHGHHHEEKQTSKPKHKETKTEEK